MIEYIIKDYAGVKGSDRTVVVLLTAELEESFRRICGIRLLEPNQFPIVDEAMGIEVISVSE